MAQNPQLRSQPSAIFTYAHGLDDFGRGRLSRSSVGMGADDTAMDRFFTRLTGTPNPAT